MRYSPGHYLQSDRVRSIVVPRSTYVHRIKYPYRPIPVRVFRVVTYTHLACGVRANYGQEEYG